MVLSSPSWIRQVAMPRWARPPQWSAAAGSVSDRACFGFGGAQGSPLIPLAPVGLARAPERPYKSISPGGCSALHHPRGVVKSAGLSCRGRRGHDLGRALAGEREAQPAHDHRGDRDGPEQGVQADPGIATCRARGQGAIRCWMTSPTRSALAIAVRAGFTAPMLGKKLVSTTYRLSSSWALQLTSSTEVAGSVPNRQVSAWCAQPAIGMLMSM